MTGKDAHLDILSAHYSETFSLLKSAVEKRDRLFLYILGVIFLLLLYMSAPSAVSDWLNSFINSKTGSNANTTNLIEVSFIGAILLLGLLSLSHTYFQTVLHIEQQYAYVYQLEEQLSPQFDAKAFIREGKHYRKYKRQFSKWTKGIYWVLFPSIISFIHGRLADIPVYKITGVTYLHNNRQLDHCKYSYILEFIFIGINKEVVNIKTYGGDLNHVRNQI